MGYAMPEHSFGVVSAAPGWHLAAIHEDDADTVRLYAVPAWLATEDDDGDPQLIPFIVDCHMGGTDVGLFRERGELAAALIPPDGTLDEDALRSRAARASRRV
jgi:hypothetical protein